MVHVGPYAGRYLFQQKPASVALITVGMGGCSSLPVCADPPCPPTIPSLPGVCSSRKLLLSALTELRGRCNLHISAPCGCNPWGEKPAHVLWSVCRIQVLRRERDLLRRCCRLGVSPPATPHPRDSPHEVGGVKNLLVLQRQVLLSLPKATPENPHSWEMIMSYNFKSINKEQCGRAGVKI